LTLQVPDYHCADAFPTSHCRCPYSITSGQVLTPSEGQSQPYRPSSLNVFSHPLFGPDHVSLAKILCTMELINSAPPLFGSELTSCKRLKMRPSQRDNRLQLCPISILLNYANNALLSSMLCRHPNNSGSSLHCTPTGERLLYRPLHDTTIGAATQALNQNYPSPKQVPGKSGERPLLDRCHCCHS